MRKKCIPYVMLLILVLIMSGSASADLFNSKLELVLINEENELSDYINNNGIPATVDHTEGDNSFSDVYEIEIEEKGTLVICPISQGEKGSTTFGVYVQLYSDYSLNSLVLEKETLENAYGGYSVTVDPGTYYLRLRDAYGYGYKTSTYLGVIPLDRNISPHRRNQDVRCQTNELSL